VKTFLRFVGAGFGLIAFVGLVIIAWGTGLPLDHTAECSASFGASPHEIWTVVADVADSPKWRTDVVRVALTPSANGHVSFTEADRYGHTQTYDEAPHRPDAAIHRAIVAAPDAAFSGSWTYRVAPASRGATLTLVENGRIYNPAFRFMARYFYGYTTTMRQYLADLGRRFGESPQIQCATFLPR
jgi:hypothetical protein